MINRLRKEEAGFTLVELLVVVLILGILVAIAVPSFTGASADAEEATAKANIRSAQSEVAQQSADGTAPTSGTFAGGTVTLASGNLSTTVGGATCSAPVGGATTC